MKQTEVLHFDEREARKVVEREIFTFEDTCDVMKEYVYLMSEEDTVWDVYVALNVCECMDEHTCMRFFFSKEGKVWNYVHYVL